MMVGMVAVDLAEALHTTVEEVLPQFLQSRTFATRYDRESKLWWDGPSCIAAQYLKEINAARQKER